jgi:hypothetical protein
MSSWRDAAARAFLLTAVVASAACLAGKTTPSPHEATLRREVAELRTLVAAAEDGTLLDFAQMLVVVDQALVQQLLASVVPLEGDVGEGFHLRVDTATATFGDGLALLRLVGEAGLASQAVSSPVEVSGRLDVVELAPDTGMLRARVTLYSVDVPARGGLGLGEPVRRLTRALAAGGLESLLGPIEVPVRIEDRLRLPPVRTRRVSIPATDVPVRAEVRSLRVFGGKMWVGVRARVAGARDGACRGQAAP